tara:strand:+ start:390 stop:716 length:327 start_codon:yes stop_codon:yes gene_type:complete
MAICLPMEQLEDPPRGHGSGSRGRASLVGWSQLLEQRLAACNLLARRIGACQEVEGARSDLTSRDALEEQLGDDLLIEMCDLRVVMYAEMYAGLLPAIIEQNVGEGGV